ncbi:MAG: hypothetical protein K5780_01245 [Alphaproteobacteria bacterium]|nr:hypothetical protein [Alphaproteobacteria bacterium]
MYTYPDGTPSLFRNIQRIEYTESKVTFYKDIKSRKCCIDIYDDGKNPNKCRIIGVNGHNITGKGNNNFEVYDVAEEANSFTDSKQRLIYVDHSGLYIVEKDKNAVEDISKNYIPNGKFDFKGEIIKISAIDGKREMLGFDKNKKAIFAFNCPSDMPVSFGIEATPFMKQIEKITGVKLVTPPPSKEVALERMAEILDIVPVELLVFDDGMVKLANKVKIISSTALPSFGMGTKWSSTEAPKFRFDSSTSGTTTTTPNVSDITKNFGSDVLADNPLIDKLKGIIDISAKKTAITEEMFEKVRNYKFDTSPKAQQRRKEIALKPWDE